MDEVRTIRAFGNWLFFLSVGALAASGAVLVVDQRWGAATRLIVMAVILLWAKRARVPMIFLGVCALSVLVATWAAVWRWYPAVPHLDTVVHVLTVGSLAAVGYFLLANARLLPDVRDVDGTYRAWAPVLWVAMVGTTTAVLWEYYEWVLEQVSPQGVIVGYTDTVADLLAGMSGSVAAGFLTLWWVRRRAGRGVEHS